MITMEVAVHLTSQGGVYGWCGYRVPWSSP